MALALLMALAWFMSAGPRVAGRRKLGSFGARCKRSFGRIFENLNGVPDPAAEPGPVADQFPKGMETASLALNPVPPGPAGSR